MVNLSKAEVLVMVCFDTCGIEYATAILGGEVSRVRLPIEGVAVGDESERASERGWTWVRMSWMMNPLDARTDAGYTTRAIGTAPEERICTCTRQTAETAAAVRQLGSLKPDIVILNLP